MNSEYTSYEQMTIIKKEIEDELEELGKTLEQEGNVGMSGLLIDSEGYPRADIDIYKVRLTRQRINCLQNDYNSLLDRIEKELITIHQINKDKSNETISIRNDVYKVNNLRAFIKIEHVDLNSPSYEAGLRKEDMIIQFGPCTYLNTKRDLKDIAELVKKSENKIILIKVSRKETEPSTNQSLEKRITLKLTPKSWSGHGFLGCKLIYVD